METVPKIVRERLQAGKSGSHPDANLLAAFAEKSLTLREQSQMLDHLAGCTPCREIVSLSQPQYDLRQVTAVPVPRTSWLSGRILQWGALAACVAVAGTVVLLRHQRTEKSAEISTYYDTTPQSRDRLEHLDSKADATTVKKLDDAPIARREPAATSANAISRDQKAALQKQRLTAREVDSRRAFALSPAPVGGLAPATSAIAEKPAAPPPSSLALQKLPAQEEAKKEIAADKVQSVPQVAANESVNGATVALGAQAESVVVESQATNAPSAGLRAGTAMGGMVAKNKDNSVNDRQTDQFRSKIAFPKTRWQISADGQIMRSQDLGESWQSVQVADSVVFRALCVTDREVWVGGSQGNLFYSSDAGAHWEQIKPAFGGQTLTSDISQIQFADPQHGTVSTTDHQTWTTADGGHAWRKQ
jgi:hypothetical protein